jgi:phosphatidylglycerophosphate synthase
MATDQGEGSGKPQDIELWSNRRLIHPLSRRLAAALSRTPVTPNMVSVAGAGAAAVAAAAYAGLPYPWSVAAGFLAHAAWHVLDGADGELARRTGRSSPTGELVDGLCDYAGQAILYTGLAAVLAATLGAWAWPLALTSGLARAVQANSYESRRREYQYWGYGGSWIRQTLSDDARSPRGGLAALGRLYLAVSATVAPTDPALRAALDASLAAGGETASRTRALYRSHQRRAIAAAAPLSANARTLALALSMALGSPLYYFAYETVGLTLLLVWSLRVQRQADAAVLEALASRRDGSASGEALRMVGV